MFTLPKLPYAYDALEPHIDKQTMIVHHDKHHAGYTDNLNAALEKGGIDSDCVVDLLKDLSAVPESVRTAVRNNGGGYYNHKVFWTIMGPNGGGSPVGEVKQLIERDFGSFAAFQEKFETAAKTQFGSGWAWLVLNQGKLEVTATPNQDCPISEGKSVLLCLDVWEHAYYLKYQNRRPDYITAFWNVINWQAVEDRYQKYK